MSVLDRDRALELTASAALTGWVAVTALSQHPNRSFDRFRGRHVLSVVVPNWRFFAPEPAMHDFRVLHRFLREDGTQSAWQECTHISPRCWRQTVWFPDRRRDKGLIDAASDLIIHLQVPGLDLTTTPAYRVLRDFVAVRLATSCRDERVQGFQFLLLRHTGHDEEPEPEYLFASRFERLPDRA